MLGVGSCLLMKNTFVLGLEFLYLIKSLNTELLNFYIERIKILFYCCNCVLLNFYIYYIVVFIDYCNVVILNLYITLFN